MSPLFTKSNATAISAAGPLPLYYQLYETLRSQILDGIWTNGDFFPPSPCWLLNSTWPQ